MKTKAQILETLRQATDKMKTARNAAMAKRAAREVGFEGEATTPVDSPLEGRSFAGPQPIPRVPPNPGQPE